MEVKKGSRVTNICFIFFSLQFKPPEDDDGCLLEAELIIRLFNHFAEALDTSNFRVENAESVKEAMGEKYIKMDISRPRVMYYKSSPPFFCSSMDILEDETYVLHIVHQSLDYTIEAQYKLSYFLAEITNPSPGLP